MSLLFSPVHSPTHLLQLFHLFCLRSGPSPLSSGAFHTTAAVTSFPIFKVAGRVPLLLPFLASLFIYSLPKGLPLPHFPGLGCPSLFAVSFFVLLIQLLVYYLVFFFSFLFPPPAPPVETPGGYADLAHHCMWGYHVLLSSPGGLHLPKQSGSWHLAVQEPFWFLHLIWSGGVMLASSWWFFL
jgi:hypothetical protein